MEDTATALLEFENGAVGVLEASTAIYPGMGERLEISGTGGTLVVESGVMRVRELKDYRGETSFYGRKVDSQRPVAVEGEGRHAREVLEPHLAGRFPDADGAPAIPICGGGGEVGQPAPPTHSAS